MKKPATTSVITPSTPNGVVKFLSAEYILVFSFKIILVSDSFCMYHQTV